jgi:hypothetical protein
LDTLLDLFGNEFFKGIFSSDSGKIIGSNVGKNVNNIGFNFRFYGVGRDVDLSVIIQKEYKTYDVIIDVDYFEHIEESFKSIDEVVEFLTNFSALRKYIK